MNGISVIVCCYNSALRLPLTLGYLSKQKTEKNLSWEIIIVNNNSKDNTVETAKSSWQSFANGKELQIIDEYKPGLSFAREAGVKAALYDIIIFCDDDNLLAENYLQRSYNLVKRTKNEKYGIWGGKIEACFDNDTIVPEWFEKEKANYVVGEQGSKSGDISSRGYVWGAGMVILKNVFFKVTDHNIPLLLTGRKENVLLAGDDSEICLRSLILGYKLYYDDSLTLKHYIPEYKLSLAYNEGLKKGFFTSGNVLNKYAIFVHYVSSRTLLKRLFYTGVYKLKYLLNKLKLRSLTAYDNAVLHALSNSKNFPDTDFDLMRGLLQIRTKT